MGYNNCPEDLNLCCEYGMWYPIYLHAHTNSLISDESTQHPQVCQQLQVGMPLRVSAPPTLRGSPFSLPSSKKKNKKNKKKGFRNENNFDIQLNKKPKPKIRRLFFIPPPPHKALHC